MNKDFVRVKACHIPGFFNENIHVLVEDAVPDEVVVACAKSLVWGGNFRTNELKLTKSFKMKAKVVDLEKQLESLWSSDAHKPE